MKNINPAITTAELNQLQLPRHQLILEDPMVRFSTKNSGLSNASVNKELPITVEQMSVSSDHAWAVFSTSSTAYVKYLRISESADWGLSLTGATAVSTHAACQRLGLYNSSGNVYLYYPYVSTSPAYFQLKRVTLTSQTSNPVSIASAANFGPQVPFTYLYASGNVDKELNHLNSIKAVVPVSSGAIVLVADHNEGQKKIFCSFYYVTSQAYTKLKTGFTGDISTSPTVNSDAMMYSQVCAYEEDGIIYVFFNTNENERTAYFTINNGIESEVELVIPIDKEDSSQNFYCNSITKINNLYLMTGRLSFKNSDETITGFDTYLTSENLRDWSIGETNSFIALSESRGKIVYTNNYLYYLGNLFWARAIPNAEIAPSANTLFSEDISSRVAKWSLDQNLDEADSFSFSLNNQDLYFNSGSPSTAGLVYLNSGQDNNLSTIGIYSIDTRSQGYSVNGIQLKELQARDIGIKKLNDWQSPIDMWLGGAYQFRSDMTVNDGLIIKSEDVDKVGTFTTGDGFKFTGLNVPYMMLFDAPYSESSIIKTSVYMTDFEDAYHRSLVGFMLGAHDDSDGNFNSLVFILTRERGGSTPFTYTPTLRKLNLTPIDTKEPDKIDTGLKYEQFISTLWREAADEKAITTSTSATYEHVSSFMVPKATKTDLMVRLNGREIEFYSKLRVRSAAGWAQGAEWALRTVTTVPDTENLYPQKNSYAGIVVSTDVAASKNWFAQGKYGDMVVQLSSAVEYNDWGRVFVDTGNRAGGAEPNYTIQGLDTATVAHLRAGMKIRIHGVSWFTGFYEVTVVEVYSTGIRIDLLLPPIYYQTQTGSTFAPDSEIDYRTPSEYPGGIPPAVAGTWNPVYSYQTIYDYEIQIALLSSGDYFGEVSSQSRATPVNNSSSYLNVETGATKKANLLEGRGVLVTSDSTAMSIRHFDSDGVIHRLKSGATGTDGSYTGFDATSPIINTNRWKFIMYHGKFFDGNPTTLGCSTNGYVIVEDEIIRYIQYTSLKRGMYPTDTPEYNIATICPAAYAPVESASLGADHIYNWKSWGGSQPGDRFNEIESKFGISPVGMLVEVLSKNTNGNNSGDGDSSYYVKSIIAPSGSVTAGIELSKALKTRLTGPITNIDNPNDAYWSVTANKNQAPEGDMVVVSGRAQFDTKKQTHSETTAVRYYPCNSSGESPYIQLNSTEYYHGSSVTTEDIIKKIAAMAGVRNVKARTSFDDASATTPKTYTLTSTPVSLPLQEEMEDFTLEGDFYIPGNSITSGAVSGRNELRIYFRNKYYIAIEQYVTVDDYQAGYLGTLYIRLATTDASINAYGSERTVESIKIRNQYSLSGTYSILSGSSSSTLTPVLTTKTKIKLSVNKKFISIEINNKKAISFCIDEYTLDGGATLAFYGAGPISLSYKSNISGNSNSVTVYGAGDPISGYALRKDSTAKSAISEILENRHIFLRSTEDGGIEFGQFWNRDYFGNLHTFIVSDDEQYSTEQIVGHITYKSDKIVSNWINESWVIENGYRYLSGSGSSVENSYYALREAKLMLRKQQEESLTRDINALPRLALQPEDEVDISHPNLISGRYIINSISLSADESSALTASYSVRKKVE